MPKTHNHHKAGPAASSFRFAVITMSDKGYAGEREDTSGPALKELLENNGFVCCHSQIVPDTIDAIVDAVLGAISDKRADLVVTTGGTGVAPSDVTPEAMDLVFDREISGMAEAMRAESLKITPHAMLSRARAGIRAGSLVVNLPGSRKAALENIAVILPALPHAIAKIMGSREDCGT